MSESLQLLAALRRRECNAEVLTSLLRRLLPPAITEAEEEEESNGRQPRGLIPDIARQIARQYENADKPPNERENSWRTRMPAVAAGMADHPMTENGLAITGPALKKCLAEVAALKDDHWEWLSSVEVKNWGIRGPGSAGGGWLTAGVAALGLAPEATTNANAQFHLQRVGVREQSASINIQNQFRLSDKAKKQSGSRLGLGDRLGFRSEVQRGQVEIEIEAQVPDFQSWQRFLDAVRLHCRRVIPAWCLWRIKIRRLTGCDAISRLGPDGFRLGEGFSLQDTTKSSKAVQE